MEVQVILPVNTNNARYRADNKSTNPDGNYKDPLMRWPLRGTAYTSEIGEGLRPLIGDAATLFWAPVFLYIGADVYDKYKNDKTEYSPDSRRFLKQAIFQGVASLILPVVAIKIGQNIVSGLGRLGKDKISINNQEKVSNIALTFIANGKMHAFENKDNECVKEFLNIVHSNLDYNKHSGNIFKNGFRKIKKSLKLHKEDNVEEYAEKTIKDLIQKRKDLINPSENMESTKLYLQYLKYIKKGQTPNVAVKSALSKFQRGKTLKGKFIKTLGGFIAVGCAIKPIDNFVEHVLIDKYVEPKLYQTKDPQ